MKKSSSVVFVLLSLCIVALGQPARIGWLSALAAMIGYALFFHAVSPILTRKEKFAAGTCWFAVVQCIQLSWMTSIEYQGYYILWVYLFVSLWFGAQFGVLTLLVPSKGKLSLQQLLFCASVWTLMEWMRLLPLCGFSWNPVGLGLTYFISSLQFSSLFGVLGLSFWVVLTNLAGLNAIRSKNIQQTGYWLVAAAVPYLFGFAQMGWFEGEKEHKTLNIALIQTDLLPAEKMLLSERAHEFISPFAQWEGILKCLKKTRTTQPDLIVLPEAVVAMPSDLCNYVYSDVRDILTKMFGREAEKKLPPLIFPFAQQHGEIWGVSNLFWCQALANIYDSGVVAGLDHADREDKKNFNSAFYFQPGGLTAERYDKQILIPLAEYLPWELLRSLSKVYGIYDFYSPGQESKIFGEKISFSPSICYEETFSEPMRQGKASGAKLFVNMTNDNYFPASSLHEQHLYHARVRAVENGIPLIRSCNSGISAVVDHFGRILQTNGSQAGSLNYSLSVFHFPTLFSFWGEGGIVCLSFIFFLYGCRMRPIKENST